MNLGVWSVSTGSLDLYATTTLHLVAYTSFFFIPHITITYVLYNLTRRSVDLASVQVASGSHRTDSLCQDEHFDHGTVS